MISSSLRSFRIFSLFLPQQISDLTLVIFLYFASKFRWLLKVTECADSLPCSCHRSAPPPPQHASLHIQTLQEYSHRVCICLPASPSRVDMLLRTFILFLFSTRNHRNNFLHAFLVYSAPHRNKEFLRPRKQNFMSVRPWKLRKFSKT